MKSLVAMTLCGLAALAVVFSGSSEAQARLFASRSRIVTRERAPIVQRVRQVNVVPQVQRVRQVQRVQQVQQVHHVQQVQQVQHVQQVQQVQQVQHVQRVVQVNRLNTYAAPVQLVQLVQVPKVVHVPQLIVEDNHTCNDCPNNVIPPSDPSVQYSTVPKQVIQAPVVVQRSVVRVPQFLSGGCR
jgi:hypothetical protein